MALLRRSCLLLCFFFLRMKEIVRTIFCDTFSCLVAVNTKWCSSSTELLAEQIFLLQSFYIPVFFACNSRVYLLLTVANTFMEKHCMHHFSRLKNINKT